VQSTRERKKTSPKRAVLWLAPPTTEVSFQKEANSNEAIRPITNRP
jgi:hypothetical protein